MADVSFLKNKQYHFGIEHCDTKLGIGTETQILVSKQPLFVHGN